VTLKRFQFGCESESAVIAFLKGNSDRILEKKFVGQAGVVVFIEVKARLGHKFGHPFDTLTPTKQKKIIQTAQNFLV
jgi:Holliday junction resolvase-like predicted endonuclease